MSIIALRIKSVSILFNGFTYSIKIFFIFRSLFSFKILMCSSDKFYIFAKLDNNYFLMFRKLFRIFD